MRELSYEYNPSLLAKAAAVFILTELIASQISPALMFNSLLYTFTVASLVGLTTLVFKQREEIKFWKLFALLIFANLPYIFLASIDILALNYSSLANVLEITITLWAFSLSVTAVSVVCNIRRSKVLLLYAIPVIAVAIFIISSIIELLI